ncbi:hypothetical protein Tco_1185431 [Tanacetum coccineum]
MMYSPNHPTSEIEDAFSSSFPDFIPASPDYVPASLGKTYSSSSNLFGVVPIASPTLSLFHYDPYMKVLQAFYAKESPIPPPTIVPLSSMFNPQEFFPPPTIVPPSSMFNPQGFFLPEGLLSPKKHNRSSSSTSALPQEFEMGESSFNEVHSNDNQIFDNVDYQLSQEMHQEEHLDSDAETEIDDNTYPRIISTSDTEP